MKRITIKDIANNLNLSVSTVSRALSGDKNIRQETKDKIFKAADELGYHRNVIAAGLRSGRTNTIAFMADEMQNIFVSQVYHGIQEVMHDSGVRILICCSNADPDQERENLRIMENSMIDGVIMNLSHATDHTETFKRFEERGIPMVFFTNSPGNMETTKVVANNYDKAFYLTDYLICSGRRKIVHITGPQTISEIVDIKRAYCDALRKFQIPVYKDLIFETSLHIDGGRRIVDELIRNNVEFDAIFACNDLVAIGAMNRLHDYGKKIPEEVSIAGFSGSPISEIVYPPLTTVELPYKEIGKKAAELLLNRIKHPDTPPVTVVMEAQIKLRDSTHPKKIP